MPVPAVLELSKASNKEFLSISRQGQRCLGDPSHRGGLVSLGSAGRFKTETAVDVRQQRVG